MQLFLPLIKMRHFISYSKIRGEKIEPKTRKIIAFVRCKFELYLFIIIHGTVKITFTLIVALCLDHWYSTLGRDSQVSRLTFFRGSHEL